MTPRGSKAVFLVAAGALTVALGLAGAAPPERGASPCANVPPGSRTAPAACILHRVGTLRDVRTVFLKIAREGVPAGLPRSETPEAKRWLAWLESSAGRLETLAALGERSVGGATGGTGGGAGVGAIGGAGGGAIGMAGGGTSGAATAGGGSQDQLLAATKQMQETQMSFNLQYLQLQSQMQAENRSYTAVSNIMKTKHDTVKNSISNVR
jgi:hypothetical protein